MDQVQVMYIIIETILLGTFVWETKYDESNSILRISRKGLYYLLGAILMAVFMVLYNEGILS